MKFELTYATMFDPPAEMDARFEAALARRSGRTRSESLVAYQRARLPGRGQ